MHPSQMGPFRRTVIVLLTIAFAGALLVFTAQANLDLLKSVYPDPRFYMFGLLALEGGVVYWTGYYLLHLSGIHKGLAVFALAVDAILSGVGFFYEMERMTSSVGTVQLPPIIVVVGFAVVFNVAMSIITHLLPGGGGSGSPRELQPRTQREDPPPQAATLSQTATIREEGQPGPLSVMWAGMTAPLMEKGRRAIAERSSSRAQQQESEETVQD